MKKAKLYVSGKITGDRNYFQKFAKAGKQLMDAGYDVGLPTLYATAGGYRDV